ASQKFVARRLHGSRRMVWNAEPGGGQCRDKRRPVRYRDDAVKRTGPGDRLSAQLRILEPHRDGVIAPGIFEDVAAIGRTNRIHRQSGGRMSEGASLISRGGRHNENSFHYSCRYRRKSSDRKQCAIAVSRLILPWRTISARDCSIVSIPSARPVPMAV